MSSSVGLCEAPAMTVADLNTPDLHLTGQSLKLPEMARKIAIIYGRKHCLLFRQPAMRKNKARHNREHASNKIDANNY